VKILLINPYYGEEFHPFFPLGLGYIATALINEGHIVEVWDLNTEPLSQKELTSRFTKSAYDLIGVTGMVRGYQYLSNLIPFIRKIQPQAYLILGGSLATAAPDFLLQKFDIDFIVIGEGEETVVELVRCLENEGDQAKIRGLMYKQDGIAITTPERDFCTHPDKFGFPTWELFPMESYKNSAIYDYVDPKYNNEQASYIGIISSRGCYYRCNYCDHRIKGYSIRTRSLAKVLQEMKILMQRYNIKHFYFWDDIFTFNKERVMEFCRMLKTEGLEISWTCNGHVNLSDYEMYCQMKKAGCFSIRFGIESGSQHILDAYNKKVTVENAMKAIRMARRAKLNTILYIMIGMIGETEETVQETVDFIDETFKPLDLAIAPPIIQYFYVTPIPGTALFQQAQDLGKVGSLESYMEKLPNFHDKLTINLTDMTNEKLIMLKNDLKEKIGQVISKRYYRFLSLASELAAESGIKK
jgi:anaerobic magnesium-protoporphyrin IX monomethyl ester cyclase